MARLRAAAGPRFGVRCTRDAGRRAARVEDASVARRSSRRRRSRARGRANVCAVTLRARLLEIAAGVEHRRDDRDARRRTLTGGRTVAPQRAAARRRARAAGRPRSRAPPAAGTRARSAPGRSGSRVRRAARERGAIEPPDAPQRAQQAAIAQDEDGRRLAAGPVAAEHPLRRQALGQARGGRRRRPGA